MLNDAIILHQENKYFSLLTIISVIKSQHQIHSSTMTSFEEQIKVATDNGTIPGVVLVAADATGTSSILKKRYPS